MRYFRISLLYFPALLLLLTPIASAFGPLELVSIDPAGTTAGNASTRNLSGASIATTPDGRWVVFESEASNLTTDINNNTNGSDIYHRDMITGITTLVSVDMAGTGTGDKNSLMPSISDDGRYVAFASEANNLVAEDTHDGYDIYRRDMLTGTTIFISAGHGGFTFGSGDSLFPSISADGAAIAFDTEATDLSSVDFNGLDDVFLWRESLGFSILLSVDTGGNSGDGDSNMAQISNDGNRVVFRSEAEDLTALLNNFATDIHVYDVAAGSTKIVSLNLAASGGGNGDSIDYDFADGGRYVVFTSVADDIVFFDGNGQRDVFVRDLDTDTTELASWRYDGLDSCSLPPDTNTLGVIVRNPKISADGRAVTFDSECGNLVDPALFADENGQRDLFYRDMQNDVTYLVSKNLAGDATSNDYTGSAFLSADGKAITFYSISTDLAASDQNVFPDVFLFFPTSQSLIHATATGCQLEGGGCGSSGAVLSGDGKRLFFYSRTPDLTPTDTNDFLWDLFGADTGLLLIDDFETGDLSAWSLSVP